MTNKFGGRTDNTENFKKNFEKKIQIFFFKFFHASFELDQPRIKAGYWESWHWNETFNNLYLYFCILKHTTAILYSTTMINTINIKNQVLKLKGEKNTVFLQLTRIWPGWISDFYAKFWFYGFWNSDYLRFLCFHGFLF